VKQTNDVPRTAVGRNVRDLPELIEHHDEAVRSLERHLAKYLKNPAQLPAQRPTCKVAKEDEATHGKAKVDAIEYLTDRISRLEVQIKEVRESVDMRNAMSYGFASYTHIEDAHAVAHASRKKGPAGCDVYLAPKPHDLLWQNLSMSRRTRRVRMFWDGLWIVLFTVAFVIPNILTSVFLSDFSHLGLVWKSFQTNLAAHPAGWAIAQGVLAPLVQTLMYMGVPIVFRRLFTHSGDVSKTSRERYVCSISTTTTSQDISPGTTTNIRTRHVTARLYAFFVFNNLLVFSVFGSAWRFVTAVIAAQDQGVWEAIRNGHLFSQLMTGLCNVSTFWLTWQMQRNLGAAVDLSQAWTFVWKWFQRTFYSPTPRELIELSAPQPFPYAEYYNNYLFVATVGLCMGSLQPIILPITAFYVSMDCVFKTYLLQYVFITKTESGGRFWKLLVNRMLFAVVLGNAVIALVVGAQGVGSINSVQNGNMLYAMVPLPFLLAGFKWYCKRAFDDKLLYYSTLPYSDIENANNINSKKSRRNDKVAVRFGNPVIFKKLIAPMVHAKSQHLLAELYSNHHDTSTATSIFATPHRRSTDRATPANMAYGDMYLTDLSHDEPGRVVVAGGANAALPNMELVAEEDLDFAHFKKRAEFREDYGGEGELYGRPDDLISRPGTPSTMRTFGTDTIAGGGVGGSPYAGKASRASSTTRLGEMEGEGEDGTAYAAGYQPAATTDGFVDVDVGVEVDIPATPLDADEMLRASSRQALMRGVGDVGRDDDDAYFSQSMRERRDEGRRG
jgi:hypothetical protein